jgi:hypothetical protein
MSKSFAAAICVAVVAGVGASAALAGEVIGPPGTAGVPGSAQPDLSTAAPFHSQSICSYNGLNDLETGQGQTVAITQTPHNSGSLAGAPVPPGTAGAGPNGSGTPGSPTCGGGSNFRTNP